jgi:hypothetical protein
MRIHKVARLLLAIDDADGTLATVAPRPSGKPLPLAEWKFTNLSAPPSVKIDQIDQRVSDGFLDLAVQPTFQITTEWRLNEARILRRFVTPITAFAERTECFDLQYTFATPRGLNFTPLKIAPPCEASQTAAGYVVRSDGFVITLRASTSAHGEIILEPAPPPGGYLVRVRSESAVDACLSFLLASAYSTPRDPATYVVSPALDMATFILSALTPAVYPISLSPKPVGPIRRASPTLLLGGATGVKPARWWASLFGGQIGWAVPPSHYPAGDVMRMSGVILYHSSADNGEQLRPIVDYLRKLQPSRLPSTQLIVILSAGSTDYARLREVIADIAQIVLPTAHGTAALRTRHLQVDDAEDLPAVLAKVDDAMDALNYAGHSRKAFRQQSLSPALPPVHLPTGKDPLLQAPFLAAARLRGNATFKKGLDAWPQPLNETKPAPLAAEVARYVLADLQTHEALRSAGTGGSHAATWKQQLALIDNRAARADRLIFALVSGADSRYDRLKLLPPILYSGHVPSPVFPMRIALEEQQATLKDFSTHMSDVAEYWAAAHGGQATSSTLMDKSSQKLQDRFQGEEWTALRNLVDLVKPREFINFSALPMEWWEIDGVPLGQLTKVVTLHSQTLESDAGVCADLPTIYNSLVMPELSPGSPECRVLVIAPQYDGPSQALVNETISSLGDVLRDELSAAQADGREIVWEVVQPRAPADLKALLEARWSLVIYVGHASEGVLCLPAGNLSPYDFSEDALLGVTAVLIGCDTKGASNLSQSVASKMLSAGARAVFATSFALPLTMAQHLMRSLMTPLLRENLGAGDVVASVRVWTLYNFMIHAMAADRGLPAKQNVAFVSPQMERAFHHDSWMKVWNALASELAEFLSEASPETSHAEKYAATILKRAATAGLSLTLAGDLRARLFAY